MKTSIKNTSIEAIICDKGAELISLKNNSGKEYIWEGNPEFWGKHSPVLFPIVGTLKNNSYFYNNKNYTLMRHGFARDMTFELIHHTESQAIFSLKANNKTKEIYPFAFELKISYTLEEHKLSIGYRIINNENCQMPFSIGAHPAFALPNDFNKYSLLFDKSEELVSYQLENNLLSEKTNIINQTKNQVNLDYSLFKNDALIFKTLKSKAITILESQNPILKVNFDEFKSLGIWTLKNAPFICIEPWLGYSDSAKVSGNILEKEAIHILDANQSFDCSFSIEIL